jgi:hypothetical protein
MLTNTEASVVIGARCSGCGSRYVRAELLFLYADERGFYCRDCGGLLVEGHRYPSEESRDLPGLVISEELEESALRRQLERLAEREGARVLVDRAGEVRTLRLASRPGVRRSRRPGEERVPTGEGP